MKRYKRLGFLTALVLSLSLAIPGGSVTATGSMDDAVTFESVERAPVASGVVPDVQIRTADQINSYLKTLNVSRGACRGKSITLSSNPGFSAPYTNIGAMSQASKTESLNIINAIRYIAGLDAVAWDSTYERYSQSAALLTTVNGVGSHAPQKPANMNAQVFADGYEGASHGNLAGGPSNLWDIIVDGWMADDSSEANLNAQGHRRWILHPAMGRTAFGYVDKGGNSTYGSRTTSMYCTDTSNTYSSVKSVVWPAQNMPAEFIQTSHPWTVSLSREVAETAKVTLKNRKTGQTWNFSRAKSDGFFNISNQWYGAQGCIIFRPQGIADYKAGDIFDVNISGIGVNGGPDVFSYTVSFFDLGSNASGGSDTIQSPAPVYRFFNRYNGEHLYTVEMAEVNMLLARSNVWIAEGNHMKVYLKRDPNKPADAVPVYRLVNLYNNFHYFTTSTADRDRMDARPDFKYEGIPFYAAGPSTPADKLMPITYAYNPGNNSYLYMFNPIEVERIKAAPNWQYLGHSFNAMKM